MKKCLILLICLLLLPISLGQSEVCEDVLTIGEDCIMLTPVIDCDSYYYEIYNTTDNITNGSLTSVEDGVYKFTFNLSDEGDYIVRLCDNSTREIYVQGEETMQGLWIFLGLIGLVSIIGFSFKEKGLGVLVGVLLSLFGVVILFLEDTLVGLTQKTQVGMGIGALLIGFYLIIWFSVKKFYTEESEDETEVIVDRDTN